jgi:NADH dehydrogenase (ubiquinone) 1 beta subcomplex subunit 9
MQEAEALLERWKHPDPYRPPTAPGGASSPDSGHER